MGYGVPPPKGMPKGFLCGRRVVATGVWAMASRPRKACRKASFAGDAWWRLAYGLWRPAPERHAERLPLRATRGGDWRMGYGVPPPKGMPKGFLCGRRVVA